MRVHCPNRHPICESRQMARLPSSPSTAATSRAPPGSPGVPGGQRPRATAARAEGPRLRLSRVARWRPGRRQHGLPRRRSRWAPETPTTSSSYRRSTTQIQAFVQFLDAQARLYDWLRSQWHGGAWVGANAGTFWRSRPARRTPRDDDVVVDRYSERGTAREPRIQVGTHRRAPGVCRCHGDLHAQAIRFVERFVGPNRPAVRQEHADRCRQTGHVRTCRCWRRPPRRLAGRAGYQVAAALGRCGHIAGARQPWRSASARWLGASLQLPAPHR